MLKFFKQPCFSIIMATYNRKKCICHAINSVLSNTYQNFELIIVDDGSTDNTGQYIKRKYAKELKSGKIRYFFLNHMGVCHARNYGLSVAKNDWIAYIDSDNTILSDFLEIFAHAIKRNPTKKLFHAQFKRCSTGQIIGKKTSFKELLYGNCIDLGVFVHKKSVYEKLGGFDTNLSRLVDWDLILLYTKKYALYYIDKTVLLYNDVDDHARISNVNSAHDNYIYIHKKHMPHIPIITTIITTYNHEKYIQQAIDSALQQQGKFIHEIIISDDGSTDSTPQIVAKNCYPLQILNISTSHNVGISANMKRCFDAANGEYIAILEGDDYWTDNKKLHKQMTFLKRHKNCSMCFSKILVLNETNHTTRTLQRQKGLNTILSAKDFCETESNNLIGNFSCCMFRAKYIKNLPPVLYTERLSEIPLVFWLDNFSRIGFIPKIMSVYRQHESGVWSGAQSNSKLRQWLKVRQTCKSVCKKEYIKYFDKIITDKKKALS